MYITYKEMMRDVAEHEGIPKDVLEKAFENEKCIDCFEQIKFFLEPRKVNFYRIMAECGDDNQREMNN